jgi:isochorismate synthase/2-succinyl-5-enolpyruvyl-6-hydroxy-3-cyclohexene-1-carboxylate synthase/2-succinyl-6-hydroxy-2,4-cyclohexadiene-1-carboxylate synthase/O-succinylbenzoate synthase
VAALLSCRRSEQILEQPFSNARESWARRELLTLNLGSGAIIGCGEASPLPGHSPDDIDSCERALGALGSVERLAASSSAQEIFDCVGAAVPERLPAARFGLETAALDRLGRALARPLWSLLGAARAGDVVVPRPRELSIAAVLPSDDAALALATAKQRFEDGVRVFKLKVGPGTLQPAQERSLAALRGAFGASIELRVDANQSFARPALAATFERLARYSPSFVEEPIASPLPGELEALACGFAFDESLSGADIDGIRGLLALDGCRALVLKPTLLGGFARCLRLARLAQINGKLAIASHALEGPIGFSACVHFALSLPPGVAHGLWPLPHQRGAWASAPLLQESFDGAGLGAPA